MQVKSFITSEPGLEVLKRKNQQKTKKHAEIPSRQKMKIDLSNLFD